MNKDMDFVAWWGARKSFKECDDQILIEGLLFQFRYRRGGDPREWRALLSNPPPATVSTAWHATL